MSDRGSYRSIATVLVDSPDFQRLPERARTTFLFLKLNFGVAGIEVWYPSELVARLSAQTGASAGAIQDALNTLDEAGWIRREANVVWIVGQLEHDPHVSAENPKHRKMIQTHVDGLPHIGLVGQFVLAHEAWFRNPTGGPTNHTRMAHEWVSDRVSNGPRSTEKEKEKEKEKEDKSLVPSDDGTGEPPRDSSYPPAFESVWGIYPKRFGGNSKKEAYQAWRARLRSGVPAEVLHAGVGRYAAFCEADRKVGTKFVMMASSFFGTGDHYLEPWEVEAPDVLPIQNRARVLSATEMLIV